MTRTNPNQMTAAETSSLLFIDKARNYLVTNYPGLVDTLYSGVIKSIEEFLPSVAIAPTGRYTISLRITPKSYLRNDSDKQRFNEQHAGYVIYFLHGLLAEDQWHNIQIDMLEFVGKDYSGKRLVPKNYSELTMSGFIPSEEATVYSENLTLIVSMNPQP